MNKRTVLIIAGGRSGEHEVSLISGLSIFKALPDSKFEAKLVVVDKNGEWRVGEGMKVIVNQDDAKKIKINPKSVKVSPFDLLKSVDVVLPIIHGTDGEDGALQGLLQMADVPYVGAGVLGSAIGMDKEIAKKLLEVNGLGVSKYQVIYKNRYETADLKQAIKKLKWPIFVKPVNAGSSVGVSKANSLAGLIRAVKLAEKFDVKIILEEAIVGREIECAVLGNEYPVASIPGEIVPKDSFYSYKAKYLDENGSELIAPARLDKLTERKIKTAAVKVFEILQCRGMGRVDFFLKKNGEIIVNEINTLPGFTKISMYPKLWQISGLSYPMLLTRLISLALSEYKKRAALKRSYR